VWCYENLVDMGWINLVSLVTPAAKDIDLFFLR